MRYQGGTLRDAKLVRDFYLVEMSCGTPWIVRPGNARPDGLAGFFPFYIVQQLLRIALPLNPRSSKIFNRWTALAGALLRCRLCAMTGLIHPLPIYVDFKGLRQRLLLHV